MVLATKPTYDIKTIFKIPVLLLALMLVVSCGNDSKKELSVLEQAAADGKKWAEATYKNIGYNNVLFFNRQSIHFKLSLK